MKNTPFDESSRLSLVMEIMEGELTLLQKQTIEDYYLHGMTLTQIAAERGVNKSTVQRTLRLGEETIRRFARYCRPVMKKP